MKHVDKASMEKLDLEEQLVNEINIMARLQHPNVLQLRCCFEDHKTVYLVTELSADGSLFKKMDPHGLPESVALPVIHVC